MDACLPMGWKEQGEWWAVWRGLGQGLQTSSLRWFGYQGYEVTGFSVAHKMGVAEAYGQFETMVWAPYVEGF
jgi:hypothetical protein